MGREFREGLIAGLPIGLGYLSVSFGIGILAIGAGFNIFEAVILSVANLTSAGQVAGIEVIAAAGGVIEIILTQLVINLRYALMALSLSQRLDDSFKTPQRLLLSYGITDEIFAMAYAREKKVSPPYMGGMILISAFGWVLGTFLGAAAGEILPSAVTEAMGIMLYGMFIAIVVPVVKKDRRVLYVSAAAIGLSILFRYVLTFVSGGFAVIICALAAALFGAVFFPVDDADDDHANEESLS
ncbi:MAG: AzlC family ABC transporter permease [Eubacterium sp.]|nr:AzlC family ABC transporter permease [Eubacterium sp.]